MRASILVFGLLVLASCGSDTLVGPGFEQRFTSMSGCADLLFYAVDDRDELMLTFFSPGLAAQAWTTGEETVTTFEFPDQAADLKLEQGTRVSVVTCDDVAVNGGPTIRRTWTATGGAATVTVRPLPDRDGATADLLLEGVTLERGDDRLLLDRLEWTNVLVGWSPG
jgi:hypothetical protein